ncbi:MAG: host attachment protein [Gammaproteobacteria bacterium]|nr:host attachment protein [Gammaproteobacteria bacterium]
MSNTWVLVAESSRAKIFEVAHPGGALVELEDLAHPASRQHEQEITADLPGRAYDSQGGQRHKMEEPTSPKHQEAVVFSRELAERLAAAHGAGAFERLVLVAPPAFLGLVREQLSVELARCVTDEVAKNLVLHDTNDIRAHLPAHL